MQCCHQGLHVVLSSGSACSAVIRICMQCCHQDLHAVLSSGSACSAVIRICMSCCHQDLHAVLSSGSAHGAVIGICMQCRRFVHVTIPEMGQAAVQYWRLRGRTSMRAESNPITSRASPPSFDRFTSQGRYERSKDGHAMIWRLVTQGQMHVKTLGLIYTLPSIPVSDLSATHSPPAQRCRPFR